MLIVYSRGKEIRCLEWETFGSDGASMGDGLPSALLAVRVVEVGDEGAAEPGEYWQCYLVWECRQGRCLPAHPSAALVAVAVPLGVSVDSGRRTRRGAAADCCVVGSRREPCAQTCQRQAITARG